MQIFNIFKLKLTRIQRIILSILNSFLMLWFTFFMLATPYVLPDEFMLVQATSVAKNLILGLEEKPDTNRVAFVNVAWDKVMIGKPDPQAPELMIGEEPITDRAKLVGLLQILKKQPNYKFIVFDINFKGKTEHDSSLVTLLNSVPRVLVSYHRDGQDKPDYPDLAIKPLGLSDIEKSKDKCLKFKIFYNDSIKTTPLLMYEKLYRKKFKKGTWFYYLGDKPVLNSFILDYRIRNFDYLQGRYPKNHLGEWIKPAYKIYGGEEEFDFDSIEGWEEEGSEEGEALDTLPESEEGLEEENGAEQTVLAENDSLVEQEENPEQDEGVTEEDEETPEDEFSEFEDEMALNFEGTYDLQYLDEEYVEGWVNEFTKDKIIFVGDFEDRDIHETIYGDTPGPIILLDAFFALEAGDNYITTPFIIFLLVSFSVISYITFTYQTIYGEWLQNITKRTKATIFEALTVYIAYFAIVSIISFFMFNIHIGVLVLAFYMYIFEKAKVYIAKRKEKKTVKTTEELETDYTEESNFAGQ